MKNHCGFLTAARYEGSGSGEMEVVELINVQIIGNYFQSSNHHQHTNIQMLRGWIPFLAASQLCQISQGHSLTTQSNSLHERSNARIGIQYTFIGCSNAPPQTAQLMWRGLFHLSYSHYQHLRTRSTTI